MIAMATVSAAVPDTLLWWRFREVPPLLLKCGNLQPAVVGGFRAACPPERLLIRNTEESEPGYNRRQSGTTTSLANGKRSVMAIPSLHRHGAETSLHFKKVMSQLKRTSLVSFL